MGFFSSNENRVRCGRCGTEFDLNKNNICPLCKFGGKEELDVKEPLKIKTELYNSNSYLSFPPDLKLVSGKPIKNCQTASVGSWGMFNSFFPGKAVARILAHMLNEQKKEEVILEDVIQRVSIIFKEKDLHRFRGFPNDPKRDSSIGRLVYHFIRTFSDMGLFEVKSIKTSDDVWSESWKNIVITLTKEGLEFAKLENLIFDDKQDVQILIEDEKRWLLDYLKDIDKQGYKEFSMLKSVFEFIKEGHNGKQDLWKWFSENKNFISYVKEWSRKSDDNKEFKEQIRSLAMTFGSSKVALLRELGVISNKRNDYAVIGELG